MRRIVSLFTLVVFLWTSLVPPSMAQGVALPAAQTMIALTPDFSPCLLRGIKIDPKMPLRFDFIVDEGNTHFEGAAFEDEANRLIKYFLATLTTPEKDLWVNLSPYENDRIIQDDFGRTAMGRDLLAQDYILKQLTASLMHPDGVLGKKFWEEIYRKVQEKYGTTDFPVDTFNKVWIVPEHADVYEKKNSDGTMAAFVDGAKLKVMLESDYLASEKARGTEPRAKEGASASGGQETQELAKNIVRSVILPALEKEVNQGSNFAQLRQVYHSLLLAVWLKKKLQAATLKSASSENRKGNILSMIFVDQKKTGGIETDNPKAEIASIYDQYVEAFKNGAYNLIREDYDLYSNEIIPRKYFSGGFTFLDAESAMAIRPASELPASAQVIERGRDVTVDLTRAGSQPKRFIKRLISGAAVTGLLLASGMAAGNARAAEQTFLEKAAALVGLSTEAQVAVPPTPQIPLLHDLAPEQRDQITLALKFSKDRSRQWDATEPRADDYKGILKTMGLGPDDFGALMFNIHARADHFQEYGFSVREFTQTMLGLAYKESSYGARQTQLDGTGKGLYQFDKPVYFEWVRQKISKDSLWKELFTADELKDLINKDKIDAKTLQKWIYNPRIQMIFVSYQMNHYLDLADTFVKKRLKVDGDAAYPAYRIILNQGAEGEKELILLLANAFHNYGTGHRPEDYHAIVMHGLIAQSAWIRTEISYNELKKLFEPGVDRIFYEKVIKMVCDHYNVPVDTQKVKGPYFMSADGKVWGPLKNAYQALHVEFDITRLLPRFLTLDQLRELELKTLEENRARAVAEQKAHAQKVVVGQVQVISVSSEATKIVGNAVGGPGYSWIPLAGARTSVATGAPVARVLAEKLIGAGDSGVNTLSGQPYFTHSADVLKAIKEGQLVLPDLNAISALGPLKFSMNSTSPYKTWPVTYPEVVRVLEKWNLAAKKAGIAPGTTVVIHEFVRTKDQHDRIPNPSKGSSLKKAKGISDHMKEAEKTGFDFKAGSPQSLGLLVQVLEGESLKRDVARVLDEGSLKHVTVLRSATVEAPVTPVKTVDDVSALVFNRLSQKDIPPTMKALYLSQDRKSLHPLTTGISAYLKAAYPNKDISANETMMLLANLHDYGLGKKDEKYFENMKQKKTLSAIQWLNQFYGTWYAQKNVSGDFRTYVKNVTEKAMMAAPNADRAMNNNALEGGIKIRTITGDPADEKTNTLRTLFDAQFEKGRLKTGGVWQKPKGATLVPEVMAAVGSREAKDLTLLDLGAGNGDNGSLELVDMGFQKVFATDISEVALREFGGKLLKPEQRKRVEPFLAGHVVDVLRTLVKEGTKVDIVHAHLSLHYFSREETEEIFRLVRQVLNPGGKFIFKVFSDEDRRLSDGRLTPMDDAVKTGDLHFYKAEDGKPTRLFSKEDLVGFLTQGRFKFKEDDMRQITVLGWDLNKPWIVQVSSAEPAMEQALSNSLDTWQARGMEWDDLSAKLEGTDPLPFVAGLTKELGELPVIKVHDEETKGWGGIITTPENVREKLKNKVFSGDLAKVKAGEPFVFVLVRKVFDRNGSGYRWVDKVVYRVVVTKNTDEGLARSVSSAFNFVNDLSESKQNDVVFGVELGINFFMGTPDVDLKDLFMHPDYRGKRTVDGQEGSSIISGQIFPVVADFLRSHFIGGSLHGEFASPAALHLFRKEFPQAKPFDESKNEKTPAWGDPVGWTAVLPDREVNPAMEQKFDKGGIDLNSDRLDMMIRGNRGTVDFKFTPEQLQMLKENISGFVPHIIRVQPVKDVPMFLGLGNKSEVSG